MDTTKQKLFRDPVHGYISVPENICKAFIDTGIFQRLRNIEQTSMSCLYPSASHNRFTHSLGVYFLAKTAFHYIEKSDSIVGLTDEIIKAVKPAFLVAALMHDCGHAPFSHTFEKHYNRSHRAEDFLLSQVGNNSDFKSDFSSTIGDPKGPAEHEIFSAAIFLKHYSDTFNELYPDSDPLLVARMITGCTYSLPIDDERKQIKNSLISLIKGVAIDMDKLDYIIRDTWASGTNNVMVDIHRLLSALRLATHQNCIKPTFNKSALSVIKNVIDGRNFLYYWIFSHHTVCYYTYILKKALDTLSRLFSPDDKPDQLLDILFSKAPFERHVEFVEGVNLYLPTDGDIYYLLKKKYSEIPEANELMTRKPRLIPLWKTYAEFKCIFKDHSIDQLGKIQNHVKDLLSSIITDSSQLDLVLMLPVKPKIIMIRENELYVSLLGQVTSYDQVDVHKDKDREKGNIKYFFVFVPKEVSDKTKCIEALKTAVV